MPVVRITRFNADPANAEDVITRRAALIAAIRDSFPGLTEARLARLDETTWIDVWYWDSAEHAQAALAAAPSFPEAKAAFEIARDATAEQAAVVDER